MENNDDLKENEIELEDIGQDDLFYKDNIVPNEPTVISAPSVQGQAPYHIKITGFSLGLKPKKNSRTCIVVKDDDDDEEPGVVGVLKEGTCENIQVDILITGSQIFSVEGTNPSKVHIVGHMVPADQYIPDEDNMGFGEDDDMTEDELEQLMRMRGAQKRQRGEDLQLETNDQEEDEEEEGEEEGENEEDEVDNSNRQIDEVEEPPAKKQKTNNGQSQTTQKKTK